MSCHFREEDIGAWPGLSVIEVLPTGFEPMSPARKAGMIGRSTLQEHFADNGVAENGLLYL